MEEGHRGAPPGGLDAALEELREYIAAAFDAVNDLAATVQSIDTRMAAAQQGITDGMSTLARALDERLDHLDRAGAAPTGADPSSAGPDPGLADTIATSLAAINRRLEGVGRVGPVLTDLAAWMAGIVERQDKVEAELVRLGDEVQAYRRRMQLNARPPLLTEEQADSIVKKMLDGLAHLVATQGDPTPKPELPTPAGSEANRRRRR